jgi:hypothetical protein
MAVRRVRIRHWLPIVTFCPVNHLPDLVWIEVEFANEFQELYAVRRRVRKIAAWRKMFMEDVAQAVYFAFPTCKSVTVRLALDRHVVTYTREG